MNTGTIMILIMIGLGSTTVTVPKNGITISVSQVHIILLIPFFSFYPIVSKSSF